MMLSQTHLTASRPFSTSNRSLRLVVRPSSSSAWSKPARRAVVLQAQDQEQSTGSSSTQQQPGPPPSEEELPIWVRREKERELQASGKAELPWPLYLVFSVLVAIASVGSVFEYVDKNAVFGVIPPESPLWAPVLGLFAFTGIPTAGFLFFKGVNAANEAAERQDKMDGYIK